MRETLKKERTITLIIYTVRQGSYHLNNFFLFTTCVLQRISGFPFRASQNAKGQFELPHCIINHCHLYASEFCFYIGSNPDQ